MLPTQGKADNRPSGFLDIIAAPFPEAAVAESSIVNLMCPHACPVLPTRQTQTKTRIFAFFPPRLDVDASLG